MAATNIEVADSYIEALRSRDCRKVLLAEDVTLEYPLAPNQLRGKAAVIEYMRSVLPGMDGAEADQHFTDGDYVITLWRAHTARATLPVCSVFRISGGLIAGIRTFFDPRPMFP